MDDEAQRQAQLRQEALMNKELWCATLKLKLDAKDLVTRYSDLADQIVYDGIYIHKIKGMMKSIFKENCGICKLSGHLT